MTYDRNHMETRADFSLTGQWALVTGASRGIGKEVALHLARHGADVILTGRPKPDTPADLDTVAEQIRTLGRRAECLYADLADVGDIQDLARRALAIHTPIPILVHVAGVVYPNAALEQTLDEWETTLAVNLRAPFLLSQALAPAMIESGGGRIIMIGSAAGIVGFAARAAYTASKGGLMMLTRQLAVEWGPLGIRVNCVAPTVTMTPMAEQAWADPTRREAMRNKIPTRRFAQPRDVANAVVYLASPGAAMINGTTLPVDGGYTVQ